METQSNNPIKPLVSLVLPAYNEAAILRKSVGIILEYLKQFDDKYNWEVILVNDGSKDETGKIADELASEYPVVRVVHHRINLNLGNALKTGFSHSKGKYVLTLDIDLSYSVEHISAMLDTITATCADMVLASPYMKGGRVTAVPFTRKMMSKWVNWIMSLSSQERYHTFTCMVRAYRGDFIRGLNLKTKDYEINSEIVYKAMILRARIIEIPAHLDWSFQNQVGKKRVSGLRVTKGIFSGLMASFIMRPYIYFLGTSLLFFLIFLYLLGWILINIHRVYPYVVATSNYFDDRFSLAFAKVYGDRPYSFLVAGLTLLVALQFLSIGFLSLQNKRYFEELFHISSSIKNKIGSKSQE